MWPTRIFALILALSVFYLLIRLVLKNKRQGDRRQRSLFAPIERRKFKRRQKGIWHFIRRSMRAQAPRQPWQKGPEKPLRRPK